MANRQHGRCYPRRCISLFLSKTSRQARAILLLSVSSTVAGVRLAILLAGMYSNIWQNNSMVSIKRPVLLNLLVWFFFSKTLYLTTWFTSSFERLSSWKSRKCIFLFFEKTCIKWPSAICISISNSRSQF